MKNIFLFGGSHGLLMIFLAIGFLETIWMWSASRKKSPTVIYPVWYRPLRFLLMAIIFLPCLLIAFDLFPSEESLRMAVAVELAALVLLFMLGRVKGKRVETRPETEEEKNARWKAQRSQAGSLWLITFAASLAAVYFIYFR